MNQGIVLGTVDQQRTARRRMRGWPGVAPISFFEVWSKKVCFGQFTHFPSMFCHWQLTTYSWGWKMKKKKLNSVAPGEPNLIRAWKVQFFAFKMAFGLLEKGRIELIFFLKPSFMIRFIRKLKKSCWDVVSWCHTHTHILYVCHTLNDMSVCVCVCVCVLVCVC